MDGHAARGRGILSRLVALDTQDGHLQSQAPTNIVMQTGHTYTLEEADATQRKHHRATFSSVDVVAQSSGELSPGIPAMWLETAYNGTNFSTGQEVRVYEKLILFTANGQVTSVKLETPDDMRTIVGLQLEQIMASLVFYTP